MISDQFSRTKGITWSFELSREGEVRERITSPRGFQDQVIGSKSEHSHQIRIRKGAEQHGWDKSLY